MIGTKAANETNLNQFVTESLGALNEVDRRLRTLRGELATTAPYFHATPTATPTPTPVPMPTPSVPFFNTPYYGAPGFASVPGFAGTPAPVGGTVPTMPSVPTTPYFQGVGAPNPPLQGGIPGAPTSPTTGTPGVQGQQLPVTGAGQLQQGAGREGPRRVIQPAVDAFDEGKEFVFRIELPGVKKESLELTAMDRGISIRAATTVEQELESALLQERGPVEFVRQIPLPVEISTAKTKARFEDGILTVTVPKKNPTEGPKKVNIN